MVLRGGVPMYQKIKRQLIEPIERGEWPVGHPLPSEAELSQQFQVSRTTIRQAIGDLVSMGYVTRQQGKGTFVSQARPHITATKLYGFAEELRQRGEEVQIQILFMRAFHFIDKSEIVLPWTLDGQTWELQRIAHIDGQPVFWETSYLRLPNDLSVASWEEDNTSFENVYGYFERCGVRIASGLQTIHAETAMEETAALLQVAIGSPLLVVERITQDDTGDPVEYSIVKYPAALYRYEVKLLRQEDNFSIS
ncbi:GntR family transcriptional regulator [Alicyclobacillus tolerans]|uniref:GntR family transcriptional regulator n=1 Tax=Alicyclobacillus tolerans TaxID=90970 RepID=UPI00101AD6E2|nr:GntR family transcriptional regulator [Alicyclobacillus montanus]